MRHISDHMASALSQGASHLCHVWLIERTDGVRLGFTDHDRDLTFLGVVCRAQNGLTQGAARQVLGLDAASDFAVSGVISSNAITAADITVGLYDQAIIRFYRVDWQMPSDYVLTGVGKCARLEVTGGIADGEGAFIAHIEGMAAQLNRVIGRRFTHLCDAKLGDARCGLDPEALVSPTCDKRYATCHGTFDNRLNFRGFPDLPGEDFLTLYPRTGDVLDGQSRQQGSGR